MSDEHKTPECSHTPTPWQVSWFAGGVADELGNGIVICKAADAALIVEAVNNHARLTEDLQIARKALEGFAKLTFTDGTPTKQALEAQAVLSRLSKPRTGGP